mgnify:CR=1 FL=1
MDQRILIARLNIEHFRHKLAEERDETTRQTIRRLLAEEEARLRDPDYQDDLVKALAAYRRAYDPRARLHIVGGAISEEYQAAVERFAAELGLADAVSFAGSVTHEELIAYYAGCDAFLCLTNHEGFCVPLLEAMFHRLPIVTWDCTAVPETVGAAGIVLPDKRPARVAAALARVVADDRLRTALADAAAARVDWFSLPRAQDRFVAALEAACRTPG